MIDTATCNAITKRRGNKAGALCHSSASERYRACLAGRQDLLLSLGIIKYSEARMLKYDHLIEFNEESSTMIVYRVFKDNTRDILISLDLNKVRDKDLSELSMWLGESILIDSPEIRDLLGL